MKRRGVSIVELLAVLSATSAVLAVGSGLLHRALSLASSTRLHLEHDRTALALGRHLRADVHAAAAVECGGERLLRIVTAAGGEVAYAATPSGLRRRATDAAGRVSLEDYRVPAGTAWSAAREGALVRLTGTAGPAPRGGAPFGVDITAALPPAARRAP